MAQDIKTSTQPKRRRELDVMGMLVVMGLVFFHTAQIFYYADFCQKRTAEHRAVESSRGDCVRLSGVG